jgi:hypothetical protein
VLSQLQLLSESDLVLRGRIVAVKALLREDESWVVTNYEIAPIHVVKQTAPMNTARPGEVTRIVLRLLGGTVVVDGRYRLTTIVPAFPESETPKLGEEMIFFMRYRVDEQGVVDKKTYNLTNGRFGIFRILNGHVQALRSAAAEKLGNKSVTVEVFLSESAMRWCRTLGLESLATRQRAQFLQEGIDRHSEILGKTWRRPLNATVLNEKGNRSGIASPGGQPGFVVSDPINVRFGRLQERHQLLSNVERTRRPTPLVLKNKYRVGTKVGRLLEYSDHSRKMPVMPLRRRWPGLGVGKSKMEDSSSMVPVLGKASGDTDALADRAQTRREVEARGMCWSDDQPVARDIVESCQACCDSVQRQRQIFQLITASAVGHR